jgi:hypothetical protein
VVHAGRQVVQVEGHKARLERKLLHKPALHVEYLHASVGLQLYLNDIKRRVGRYFQRFDLHRPVGCTRHIAIAVEVVFSVLQFVFRNAGSKDQITLPGEVFAFKIFVISARKLVAFLIVKGQVLGCQALFLVLLVLVSLRQDPTIEGGVDDV